MKITITWADGKKEKVNYKIDPENPIDKTVIMQQLKKTAWAAVNLSLDEGKIYNLAHARCIELE